MTKGTKAAMWAGGLIALHCVALLFHKANPEIHEWSLTNEDTLLMVMGTFFVLLFPLACTVAAISDWCARRTTHKGDLHS